MRLHRGIRLLALLLALACLPWGAALAEGGEGGQSPAPINTNNSDPSEGGDGSEGGEPTPPPTTPDATATPGGSEPTPTPEHTAAPSATPTPGATSTPVPSASPNPSATPSAAPTAAPSATPQPSVTLNGDDAKVLLGDNFNPLTGVTAVDENGTPLTITLLNDDGFDYRCAGTYTLKYQAIHPVTGKAYTFTRTITVYKSAAQEKYKITIVAGELVFEVGSASNNLLKDAKALDEKGKSVPLGVYNSGGFSSSYPGKYTVVLAAQHPESGEIFKQSRSVRVLSAEDYAAWQKAQRRLSGGSNERYAKYLQYRNEIYGKLNTHMDELTLQMEQRINSLSAVFADKKLELVSYVPMIIDDSGEEDASDALAAAAAKQFPVNAEGYIAIPNLKISNWSDILAVFVANSSLDVEEPLDLMNLRKIEYDGLGQVFWDMNDLTYHVDGNVIRVMITPKSALDMADSYGWEEMRRLSLEELLQPEFLKVFASLTGDTSFDDMSAEDEESIRATLPAGLDVQRESIVLTAVSLVDKLTYFWGGKYNEIGWNPTWGIPRRVTSEGSVTTGKVRNYGLDCSGFVTWSFINAIGDTAVVSAIGEGSANQWAKSKSLGWDEGQPGDLAFRAKPGSVDINHVGIIAYKTEDGQYMIVHSSSKANGVVLTEALSSGFRYLRRPALYAEAEEAATE